MSFDKNMMAKRKCDLRKVSIKRPKQASKCQTMPSIEHCSQNDEDICEIGWDSPKPLSGQNSDTTVADIVAQLTRSVAGPVLSSPIQLQYTSPQTCTKTATTPSKATLHGLRRQPRAKQLSFNQAIMYKVMAVINEYKPRVDEIGVKSACADEHVTTSCKPTTPTNPPAVTRTSMPVSVNDSTDDLWTDEDESLIHATQAFLDTVFPEPSIESASHKKIPNTISKLDQIKTSTPNLRPRTSRLTFRLDPPSDMSRKSTAQDKKQPASLTPSISRNKSVLPRKRSLNTEMSCAEELLLKLAEPDEVLESLLFAKTDSAGDKLMKTDSAVVEPSHINLPVMGINNHDSFLGDNDILDSPELAAVIEEVEFRATQGLSTEMKSNIMSNTAPTSKWCAKSITAVKEQLKSISNETFKSQNAAKLVAQSSALPEKKLCSVDEIERKRQEAMQRRSKALVKSYR